MRMSEAQPLLEDKLHEEFFHEEVEPLEEIRQSRHDGVTEDRAETNHQHEPSRRGACSHGKVVVAEREEEEGECGEQCDSEDYVVDALRPCNPVANDDVEGLERL